MMRCTIGAFLLVLAGAAAAGDKASIIKNCRLEWPANPHWRQLCYQDQQASRKTLNRLRSKGYHEIVNGCMKANPGAMAGTDWEDALTCTRWEMKAARRASR